MKPQIAVLISVSIVLAACAIIQPAPQQPTAAKINTAIEMAIRYAIQGIPAGHATEKVGNLLIEAGIEHTFYDSMASYIFHSNPCHRLRVKIQNVESYYTACELGGGHYAIVKGEYSFNAIEKIRSGEIPSAFQLGK